MSSGWQSRNTLLNKGLLVVTSALLFICFTSIDLQMRYYEHYRTKASDDANADDYLVAGDFSKADDQREQSQQQQQIGESERLRNVSRRKLSSHEGELQSESQDVVFNRFDMWNGTSDLSRRLPEAIIIGVKKGGTRALLEILRLHPDVRAPGPEPHFFDRYYYKGLHWYRKQMPLSLSDQLTMEKTPSYFVTPEVPSRIHNMSKHIRMLVVVRDPVTRAVSDYTQAWSKRPGDRRTFEDMAFLNTSTGLVDTDWSAIKIGVYAKHLERWLNFFPKSQFYFVSGERLISDPVSELEGVQKFLGLRPVISAHHFFFNQTKGFPCLRRSPHSTVPHCLGKTKGRSHPYIPPSALHRLRDFYRPFNQKFYRMVGTDFGWL